MMITIKFENKNLPVVEILDSSEIAIKDGFTSVDTQQCVEGKAFLRC